MDAKALLKQQKSSNIGPWKSRFVGIGVQVNAHIELIRQGLFDEVVFNEIGFKVINRVGVFARLNTFKMNTPSTSIIILIFYST